MDASVIGLAVSLARSTTAAVTTVASPFARGEDPADPNIVKVVVRDGTALYFSRSLIPRASARQPSRTPLYIGLDAYRAGFLPTYVSLAPTPLERNRNARATPRARTWARDRRRGAGCRPRASTPPSSTTPSSSGSPPDREPTSYDPAMSVDPRSLQIQDLSRGRAAKKGRAHRQDAPTRCVGSPLA